MRDLKVEKITHVSRLENRLQEGALVETFGWRLQDPKLLALQLGLPGHVTDIVHLNKN
jgi:hypothetical protein